MRVSLLALLCIAFPFGCATHSFHPPSPSADPANVRMPVQTPYDNDPAMRAVYLNYYWFGYHDGMRGVTGSFCGNNHPWYDVQRDGISDGYRDGIAAFSESKRPN